MLSAVVILIVSLLALALGAESLVRGASVMARRMGISSFFIGLTIVGFGTSTPELGVGLSAAFQGVEDVNVGNVVGSNIVNIAAIIGLGSLIAPTPVKVHLVRKETLLVIGLSFIPYVALLSGGFIARPMGALLALGLVIYLVRSYIDSRREADASERDLERELEHELGLDRPGIMSRMPVSIAGILLGFVMLGVGAHFLVQSAVEIARSLGISELIISLSIIAFGTSAPELFTTVVAAIRKQADIAVGNILGSNVFNLLGILGITSMVVPQRVSPQVMWLDAPIMIALSIALLPIMTSRARISRREGGFLLAVYLVYMTVLFTLAPIWFPPAVP